MIKSTPLPIHLLIAATFSLIAGERGAFASEPLSIDKESRIVLLGNGLGSRMMEYGYFETEMHRRYSASHLFIRNMCDEGNTPGFRPHSARPSPWAFPGAEKFHPPLSKATDRWRSGQVGVGNFDSPDGWLKRLEPDLIIAFFGYNESFNGPEGLDRFKAELTAFVQHTKTQSYNGEAPPQLALVSPTAFEDLSGSRGTPDGRTENTNLTLYTGAIEEVAKEEGLPFVNLFALTTRWIAESDEPITLDGALLTEAAYSRLAPTLADALFGEKDTAEENDKLLAAVREKNWMWHKLYKVPNGVHVHGRRHKPFGPQNYPDELKKLEEMTAIRDRAIWAALENQPFDLAAEDAKTHPLAPVESNYRPSNKNGSTSYLYGKEALDTFQVADGYRIELFASEKEFNNLANPVQMSFDNQGRLWVATMPTYPHYKPGGSKPDDKLLILEDTDNDGRADKETIFADGLHLPTGFEFAPEGVYVAQGNQLILLADSDGDDQADKRELVLQGFDDHDTHHVISAFCADPSGAIYMGEGTFLHSHIETAYGPVKSSNGGFFRYDPSRRHLERTARLSIPNPWGTAFDRFGQPFFLDTSDPNMRWMIPGSVKVGYGEFAPGPPSLIENQHRVRPTSGLEFISSRHFPDDVQGDILLNNTIGFLGTKQHQLVEDGTGYQCKFRQDLVVGKDGNFRPVDMEFAPDGSLYLLDWHNVLIGHMQHSARDPLRDHQHGRVYRITYPERPLVEPAPIEGAPIPTLLENLKLPEDRTRYRTRRELRSRSPEEVLPALKAWTEKVTEEPALLEALWVGWGMNSIDEDLLRKLLSAEDHRVRAAAVHVLRYSGHQVAEQADLLMTAASDPHGRVRLEAIAAASWLEPKAGLAITEEAGKHPIDSWIEPVYTSALASLRGEEIESEEPDKIPPPTEPLGKEEMQLYTEGAEVYRREGHCATCHQENGEGLPAAMFPPLAGTQWVMGNEERLIKLTLNGLMGPIEVKGKQYPGLVPMNQFKGLSDREIAAVLTYVRNTFGNSASAIRPEKVKSVREETKEFQGFYEPADLLKAHPHPKE